MTIQECYEKIGANYDEILGRIGKAERIEKFLKLFLKDDSYPGLCKAMEEKDYKQAFACAHNLKGVCLNLSLGPLATEASELCELLRGGTPKEGAEELFAKVQKSCLQKYRRAMRKQPPISGNCKSVTNKKPSDTEYYYSEGEQGRSGSTVSVRYWEKT